VNVGVAAGAWRQLRRSCVHPVHRAGRDRAVALVAQRVDVRHIQQSGVLRTVRRMARQATFSLDCGVLINKGSAGLRVALGANCVLISCGFQVVVSEGAVSIVAVRALHESLVHLVVERHIERRFYIGVALKTESRLRRLEQRFLLAVDFVAANAADAALGVGGTIKVGVCAGMATET